EPDPRAAASRPEVDAVARRGTAEGPARGRRSRLLELAGLLLRDPRGARAHRLLRGAWGAVRRSDRRARHPAHRGDLAAGGQARRADRRSPADAEGQGLPAGRGRRRKVPARRARLRREDRTAEVGTYW